MKADDASVTLGRREEEVIETSFAWIHHPSATVPLPEHTEKLTQSQISQE